MNNKTDHYFSTLKKLLILAVPLAISNMAYIGMQVVDTVMMGSLGPTALAVGALGGVVIYNILVFFSGTVSATATLIAQSYGAKNYSEMNRLLYQGILLAIMLSLPCIIIIILIPHLLLILGLNSALVHLTKIFLCALAWSIPGWLVFSVLRDFVSTLGHPKIVLVISVLAILLNAFLNYVLMYGKLGLPALGVVGIGYSTSIVRWCMLSSLVVYIYLHANLSRYALFSKINLFLDWNRIKKIVTLGYPTGLMMGFEIGMFTIMTVMMGYFGIAALAAHQIAIQCANIVFNVPLGISQAAGIHVGYAVGAKQSYRIRQITYLSVGLGTVFAIIITTMVFLMPLTIARLFVNIHSESLTIQFFVISFLKIATLLQLLDSVQIILLGVLRGMSDTFIPMLFGIGAYWVIGISCCYILAFIYNWQGIGLWWGLCLGIGASTILLATRFYKLTSQFIPRGCYKAILE